MFSNIFKSLGGNFIAGGDWNSKHIQWGSRLCTPRGRSLLSAIRSLSLDVFTPNTFTYWPTSRQKQPDLLDFFVCKGLRGVPHRIYSSANLSSDHSPVHLTLWVEPAQLPHRPSLTSKRMDWEKYREELVNSLSIPISLKTENELEEAVEYFTQSVQKAAWASSVPTVENKDHLPAYPDYIRALIRERRKARKSWQTTRLPTNRRIYNRLNNELKKLITKYKRQTYETYTSNLNADDGSLWRSTRRALQQKVVSMPLRREDGTWAITDSEKTEIFSEHLTNIFTPHTDSNSNEHETQILDTLNIPLQLRISTPSSILTL